MEIWRYWTLNQYRICKTPVLQRKSQYMGIFCGNYNIWALLSQKPKNHMRFEEIFFHNQNSLWSNILKVGQWVFAQSLSLALWDMGGWWGVVSARLSSGGHLCLPLPFIFNRLSPRKRPPYLFVASMCPDYKGIILLQILNSLIGPFPNRIQQRRLPKQLVQQRLNKNCISQPAPARGPGC